MTDEGGHPVRAAFSLCFLALMALMGILSVVACLAAHLSSSNPEKTISADGPVVTSFKEKYPFDGAMSEIDSDVCCLNRVFSFVGKFRCLFVGYRNSIERYSSRNMLLFSPMYRLITAIDVFMGNDLIENGASPIVRLPKGYFSYIYPYRDDSESRNHLRELNSWLKERNIPLLQLLPSTKADDRFTVFPPGIPNGYSRMIAEYKDFLAENDIPCLDGTEILLAENDDFHSWFYKTDHHWNVFAGRLIAETTARHLHDDFGLAAYVSAIQESNFTMTQYPALFKGSMALKGCAGPEDFQVLYQRKENTFHLEVPSMGIDRTGGLNDTLIVQPYLKTKDAYTYAAFLYGDRPLVRIENHDCTNTTRVLVIKHSQADVVSPYLACTIRCLDVIDPRYFDGNIQAFIEETKPNIVIICI